MDLRFQIYKTVGWTVQICGAPNNGDDGFGNSCPEVIAANAYQCQLLQVIALQLVPTWWVGS